MLLSTCISGVKYVYRDFEVSLLRPDLYALQTKGLFFFNNFLSSWYFHTKQGLMLWADFNGWHALFYGPTSCNAHTLSNVGEL